MTLESQETAAARTLVSPEHVRLMKELREERETKLCVCVCVCVKARAFG